MFKKKSEHIIEVCGARVLIIDDKVQVLSEPKVKYCPVYHKFLGYEKIDKEKVEEIVKAQIKDGLYTANRTFPSALFVTFGASEMLSMALESKIIDSCVIVCDGAGTVIIKNSKLVQGIGARLTGIHETSPIMNTIEKIRKAGEVVIDNNANLDQIKGVKEAIKLGHRKIAVSVAGFETDIIKTLREIELKEEVKLYILSIHNVSLPEISIKNLLLADMVWSCSSHIIRERIGSKSLMQIGNSIPVFVLSERGKEIALNFLMKTNFPILIIKSLLPTKITDTSPYRIN